MLEGPCRQRSGQAARQGPTGSLRRGGPAAFPFVAFACVAVVASMAALASCSSVSPLQETSRKSYRRITFAGIGPLGTFDPSLASEPGQSRLWMSYSTVEPSYRWTHEHPHTIGTRLAFSEDAGATWIDAGVAVNRPLDETTPVAGRNCGAKPCTWNFEVSRLVHDPGAPVSARWKIFYHRYLMVSGDNDFRIGWIGMKEAPVPTALANATERVFLSGTILDARMPAPEVSLKECLVVTEPGALVQKGELFLVVHCAKGWIRSHGSILLYRLDRSNNTWQAVGPLLQNDTDGADLEKQGIPAVGFSAPDLFQMGDATWLVVTPTFGRFPDYRGCYFFRVEDLATARISRGVAGVRPEHVLVGRSHNGACAALSGATASGVFLSELHPDEMAPFHIYMTGMHL